MKFIYSLALIVVLIAVGCSNQPKEEVTVIDDSKDITDNSQTQEEESGDSDDVEGENHSKDTPSDNNGIQEGEQETEQERKVESIESFEQVYLTDWLDGTHVLAVKQNNELEPLDIEELQSAYPTSIYSLDISTGNYTLIVADETMNLSDARISDNGNYLIYSANTLGDPIYRVYNIHNEEVFQLSGEPIGGAISADWVAGNDIIGSSYAGSVYMADVSGDMRLLEDMTDSMVFLLGKAGNTILYNTNSKMQLLAYDLDNGEQEMLPFEDARGLEVSPEGDQLLVANGDGNEVILYQHDMETKETHEIDGGAMISALSWSPSQRYVAYSVTENQSASMSTLYVYDFVTGKKSEIGVEDTYITTSWSEDENKLIYATYDGNTMNSSIVYFEKNTQYDE